LFCGFHSDCAFRYFDQYPRPYHQAIAEMKKLSESNPDERCRCKRISSHLHFIFTFYDCRDAIKKSHIILNITGAIVSYWKHGGINMEKLGADDLMPAFMYSLVKANVPNLYSELQFLNEFVVERNYSADEFNHYLMTRKRMSDLEAALHFINSIDMNVRDEKNALVPVTTMVDRVIDILHVGVAECLERKVVCYQPLCMPFTCCKAL
jgi:Vacuolar sorting protein 9 (VPS9) domain